MRVVNEEDWLTKQRKVFKQNERRVNGSIPYLRCLYNQWLIIQFVCHLNHSMKIFTVSTRHLCDAAVPGTIRGVGSTVNDS
jgi:hypothetical protein